MQDAHLAVRDDPLGVEPPEAAGLGRAVRGLVLLVSRPSLSLRLRRLLLGSELGVARRGVPELLRRRAGSWAGEETLEGVCSSQVQGRCNMVCHDTSQDQHQQSTFM